MRGLGVGVLVAALAVAGCGGGDESDAPPDTVADRSSTTAPEGLALADWQQASRGLCSEYLPRVEAELADAQAATTLEGVVAEATHMLDLSLEMVEGLLAIPVPTERTRQVERVNDRLDRGAQAIAAQRRDLETGDYDGVVSQLGVLTNYTDTDDLYLSLDVPECAPYAE